MRTQIIRTLKTEAAKEIHGQTTLYDLRAFLMDTEDMDDMAKVRIMESPGAIGDTYLLRLIHETDA